jgi:DNA repair photolyase
MFYDVPRGRLTRKGRGAVSNATGRFESERRDVFDDGWGTSDEPLEQLETRVTVEKTRSALSSNQSPDIGFNRSINPYRGCEHGCIYCYARPTHAYLGLSPGQDFESRIVSKPEAPAALKRQLAAPGYRCEVIAVGANTDPYQPVEQRLGITRQLLEIFAECRHPICIVTKSHGVVRDIDLLQEMAHRGLVNVMISITTLDRKLARYMEPRAAAPHRRLNAVAQLAQAGVPVGVLVAPLIPALNDADLETVLEASAAAGARSARYVFVRLPLEIKDLFTEWLEVHYPDRADRVLRMIREARGGELNDPRFGSRMRGTGAYADLLARRYLVAARRHRLHQPLPTLDCSQFRPPQRQNAQLSLFVSG